MITHINSCAVIGIDGRTITVEVDVCKGHPSFNIVGLPDAAVREAKERVRAAMRNSDFGFPYTKRVVVNLAPASLRKAGAGYDMPIAIGIILSSLKYRLKIDQYLFIGELSLEGRVSSVSGVLAMAIHARNMGYTKVFVPESNYNEAILVDGITIIPVQTLRQLYEMLLHNEKIQIAINQRGSLPKIKQSSTTYGEIGLIKGQVAAKRALEIIAAGGHNMFMVGSPGTGKTLLAHALPSLLPIMNKEEQIEVTKIYSSASMFFEKSACITQRPFRSPHHTCSASTLIGGGAYPRPGEITLAHRGVLFLDELTEFKRSVLETLRQPLEKGSITIKRNNLSLSFPASCIVIGASNPCPCGFYGSPNIECKCTAYQVIRYNNKISGPLSERFDIKLELSEVNPNEILVDSIIDTSADVRKRVEHARLIQQNRFNGYDFLTNSEMTYDKFGKWCNLSEHTKALLHKAQSSLHLSVRSVHRIIKVARTIADLDSSELIKTNHMAESIQYRIPG